MTCPLSIVIPSYNRPDLLADCLRSVCRWRPAGSQVLVVDDASEGESVSRAARDFPQVEVLRQASRGGFCAAVNAGVQAAAGAVVQLLNDDTEVSPGWAEPALAHFASAAVAAVTPLVLIGPPGAGPAVVDSTGDRYFVGGVASKRGHGEPLSGRHLVPGPVFGASGSASFFRRSSFLAVGGLAVELGAYFDDVDLSFRIRRAGLEVIYEPASRVHHRVSSSYGAPRGDLLRQQSRNEELVFWRNLPAGELLASLPVHLAVLAGKAVRRMREGQLLPFLSGRLAALASAGEVWRYRQWQGRKCPTGQGRLAGALDRGLRGTGPRGRGPGAAAA